MSLKNCSGQTSYKILANKVDLDLPKKRLTCLQKMVGNQIILLISALYQQGFDQVKTFLVRNL